MKLDSSAPDFEAAFARFLTTKREVSANVDTAVAAIIARIKAEGDKALIDLSAEFDKVDLARLGLRVSAAEIEAAVAGVDPTTLAALELARDRIARHHQRQRPVDDSYRDDVGA